MEIDQVVLSDLSEKQRGVVFDNAKDIRVFVKLCVCTRVFSEAIECIPAFFEVFCMLFPNVL